MKRIFAVLFAMVLVFGLTICTHAEDETESAMTETVAEQETEAEAETEAGPVVDEDVKIEDIIATLNAMTPEQFQKVQSQIIALSKATGWEAFGEAVEKNAFFITLCVITGFIVVYFVMFKRNNAKTNNGINLVAEHAAQLMVASQTISKEAKEECQKSTDMLSNYLEKTEKLVENLAKKDDAIAESQDKIVSLEATFNKNLEQNQGAILALASVVNSLLQMSGIPDEEKAMIRIRYENELKKMEGGEQK